MSNNQAESIEGGEILSDAKKQDPLLGEKLVRRFLDDQLVRNPATGLVFYNTNMADEGTNALRTFKAFHKNNPKQDEREAAQKITKDYIYQEILTAGILLESKRKALYDVLSLEFDIPEDRTEREKLRQKISALSLDKLSNYLSSRKQRDAFMDSLEIRVPPSDALVHFCKMFQDGHLTDVQKDEVGKILFSQAVHPSDVSKLLNFFPREDEEKIIRYFLPTLTLGELRKILNWSEGKYRETVEKIVRHNQRMAEQFNPGVGGSLTPNQEAVMYYNLDEIIVPPNAGILEPGDIHGLLEIEGRETIANAIMDKSIASAKALELGNHLNLKPDKEGKLLPDFIEKLRELGIEHPENFRSGNFIQGEKDGRPFCFQIVTIEDDPEKNQKTKGEGKFITIKNILTEDGSIDANWKTKGNVLSTSQFSYWNMHAIMASAKTTTAKNSVKLITEQDLDQSVVDGEMKKIIVRDDIHTIDDLNAALSETDQKGPKLIEG